MGVPAAEVHIKLRGNILHVLCETQESINQSAVLLQLVRSLLDAGQESLLHQTYPQVYQLYIYSRLTGQPNPDWTAPIYLNRLERHLAQLVLENQDEDEIRATQTLLHQYAEIQPDAFRSGEGGSGAIVLSNLSLARRGDPEAIAWYLSETLSALDVGVLVSIKAIPGTAHLRRMAVTVVDPAGEDAPEVGSPGADPAQGDPPEENASADHPESFAAAADFPPLDPSVLTLAEEEGDGELHDTTIPRLWIFCEATYSPDPSLIARPTAERLRQLKLTQFEDAVLLLQVRGEHRPDWSLRIDLTPPEEMLREWGRWGDVDALERLVNMAVASTHTAVEAELTQGTLHLVCRPAAPGDMQYAAALATADGIVDTLAESLESLAPQGVPRAVIYGQIDDPGEPAWVRYLDLPAASHGALAETPEFLGQTGDLPALAFLLTRHLNPNLDDLLATGGLRVQLLVRDKLLHVMVDSPVTPHRRLVGPPITHYLMDLNPVGIEGVRIYGRRSGEAQPAWSYGKDFVVRSRLVPESTPEFSASDAYVNELLARPDGNMSTTDAATAGSDPTTVPDLGGWLGHGMARVRQGLLRSHLFSSSQSDPVLDTATDPSTADGIKIAVVWGAVGVLLALQMDWILGQVLTPPANPALAEPEPTATASAEGGQGDGDNGFERALSELNWPAGETADTEPGDQTQTQAAEADGGSFITAQEQQNTDLSTSPSQPIVAIDALVEEAVFSTFNSQQLNEKLALYHQRLDESGPVDIMIVGSSRALRGVDPVALRKELAAMGYENATIFNFGINGATAQVVDLVIRQVLEPDQLPKLIIWADGARAFNSGRVDVTYNAITASPGYRELVSRRAETAAASGDTDGVEAEDDFTGVQGSLPNSYAAMDQWMSERLAAASSVYDDRDRLKGWLQERLVSAATPLPDGGGPSEEKLDAPMPEGSIIDFNGFLALSVRFNPATYYQDFARVSGLYDGDYNDFRLDGQQAEAFVSLLDFTQQQNIPIVFVNTPLTDEYMDDYRQDSEAQFSKYMLQQSTSQAGFIFRDLGQLWPQRYDYFSDPSHLNRYGAYQVSNQLAQDPMIAWPKSNPTETP
jgi:hypothetical protein